MSTTKEATKIKVVIRPRGVSQNEQKTLSSGAKEAWKVDGDNSITLLDTKGNAQANSTHRFDRVFSTSSKTSEIYAETSRDIIAACIEGFNGTIFAYGQTSSGKTYTMSGTNEEPGIIPTAVDELFEHIAAAKEREFLVRVSYVEIYNEVINDLLQPESTNLKVLDDIDRGVFVADLQEEVAVSPKHVMNIMKLGEVHRSTGATNMNDKSSRSHAIFRMTIESRVRQGYDDDDDGAVRVSCLNLVDLAGSERANATGAEGQRLKEGCHINKSLLTLSQVITKLSEGSTGHVPYRDSKLTRLLQPALGGNARTAIICTVTLSRAYADETLSTLKFAGRAKDVTNQAQINEVVDDATMLKRAQKEIAMLKAQMAGEDTDQGSTTTASAEEVEKLRQANLTMQRKLEKLQLFFAAATPKSKKKKQRKFRHSVAPSSMSLSSSMGPSRGSSMMDLFAHKRKASQPGAGIFSPPTKRSHVNPDFSASSSSVASSAPLTVGSLAAGESETSPAMRQENEKLKEENAKLAKQVAFMEEMLDKMEAERASSATAGPAQGGGDSQATSARNVDSATIKESSSSAEEERLREERVRLLNEALAKAEDAHRKVGPTKREVDELTVKLRRAEERERKALAKVSDLSATAKDKSSATDDLRSELASMRSELAAKEKELKNKDKESRQNNAQIRVELTTLKKQNTLLQKQVDKANTASAKSEQGSKIKALEKAVNEAREEVPPQVQVEMETLEARVSELEAELTTKDEEFEGLRGKLQAEEAARRVTDDEKNKIFEEMVELKFKQEEDKTRWAEEREAAAAQAAEAEERANGASALEEEIARMQAEADAFEETIQGLRRELTAAGRGVRDAEEKAGRLMDDQGEAQNALVRVHELEQDCKDLRAINETQESTITRLEAEVSAARRRRGGRSADEMSPEQMELLEAKAEANKLKADLARLSAHAETLVEDNNRMRNASKGGNGKRFVSRSRADENMISNM